MSEHLSLYVEFGPVESFIAEARRTRDTWAGSYILSCLMAHALLAARAHGATIMYPAIDDDLLIRKVASVRDGVLPLASDIANRVGSLPDRFEAEVSDQTMAQTVAEKAADAWRAAWVKLAGETWSHFWQQWPCDARTREIWDRQIGTARSGGPWVIRWTVGSFDDHLRRWQFFPFQDGASSEQGEMSTLGGGRAALRSQNQSAREFWQVADSRARSPFDLLPDGRERLDAVGAVKRFFPYVAGKALGWRVPIAYPSTRTIAAGPWLRSVLTLCQTSDPVAEEVGNVAEWLELVDVPTLDGKEINGALSPLAEAAPATSQATKLLDYDGAVFYIREANLAELHIDVRDTARRADVSDLQGAVRDLIKVVQDQPLPQDQAPPVAALRGHIAILAMDGDRLSRVLADQPNLKGRLSTTLATFSRGVPERVEDANMLGRVIYAGGDDVLAFLPVDTALAAAGRVRDWYVSLLKDLSPQSSWSPTISAALLYAPAATPLRTLLHHVHTLLEDEAKGDRALGRDAFAVEAWSRGGPILRVGRPWASRVASDDAASGETAWIDEIAWAVKALHREDFTTTFFYRLQPLLTIVGRDTLSFPEHPRDHIEERQIDFLLAEHLKTRRDADLDPVTARPNIRRLVKLLQHRTNATEPNTPPGTLEWNMARFVRFLVEEDEE